MSESQSLQIAVFGLGSAESSIAGCVALLAHGLYKAAAFMVVGILDHQHGTRDTRLLPRIERGWGTTSGVAVVAAASMAIGASGLVKPTTVVLLTPEEVDQAVKKTPSYTPPGR